MLGFEPKYWISGDSKLMELNTTIFKTAARMVVYYIAFDQAGDIFKNRKQPSKVIYELIILWFRYGRNNTKMKQRALRWVHRLMRANLTIVI